MRCRSVIKQAKEEETVLEQIGMEKRAVEEAKAKMAATELENEKLRREEEKRLLDKISTGGGEIYIPRVG